MRRNPIAKKRIIDEKENFMLSKYFEFQSAAKILSGEYALENIPWEMRNLGAVNPLVLSDSMLEKIGTLQKVLDALASQDLSLIHI